MPSSICLFLIILRRSQSRDTKGIRLSKSAPKTLRIATRNSPLALWQAHYVRDRLLAEYSNLSVEIVSMTTKGDQILDRSLSKVGGKGLFMKELEEALLAVSYTHLTLPTTPYV